MELVDGTLGRFDEESREFYYVGYLTEEKISMTVDGNIYISGGKLIVKVRGAGLALRAMNAGQLLITGTIQGVDLT